MIGRHTQGILLGRLPLLLAVLDAGDDVIYTKDHARRLKMKRGEAAKTASENIQSKRFELLLLLCTDGETQIPKIQNTAVIV